MSVLVAGGGPAGATAALFLARAGTSVTVFERDAESTHQVCGEFLGGDALAGLTALGVDPKHLGAARIRRLRLVRGKRMLDSALPFAACGLSRKRLDAALLDAAEAAGATVRRGCPVRVLHADGRVEVAGLGVLDPAPLFLATGKHDLRGARRRPQHHAAATVGLKLHLRLTPSQTRALGDAIELLVFRDTYAGLQPIEDGLANLCLLTPAERLSACGGWAGLLADLQRENPHLQRRMDGAEGWARPLAIAGVPYGFVHDGGGAADGVWRLGDQMGVIHSFTGDGVAIALATARLAAECFLAGGDAAAYHRAARAKVRGPIRLASGLYRAGRQHRLQAALMGVARLWPGILGQIAVFTRAGLSEA